MNEKTETKTKNPKLEPLSFEEQNKLRAGSSPRIIIEDSVIDSGGG
ncbi:MAG: hypothetical protein KAW12_07900 [Candidatus Aminicenantes bacterium]|nr:hypothetical protein [Candidatus Aminicenantes bacterium]